MLLRSSSTPLLGSLHSESPNSHHHHQSDLTPNHTPNSIYHSYSKLSCTHGGYQNFTKSLYPSNSPISPSVSELSNANKFPSHGFRRAQSEGNLEGLAKASTDEVVDEFSLSKLPKMLFRKPPKSFLETIPSFSIHNSRELHSDDDDSDEGDDFDYISRHYSLGTNTVKEEMSQNSRIEIVEGREEMFLARGLGFADISCFDDGGCGIGGGVGGGYRPVAFDRDGDDSQGLHIEEHYKRMIQENPGNSLLLRNYANFLYQTKKDLEGAEEYYSRAILADPSDGEILSQYAKLIWELHRDTDTATTYFERAVQAASSDSHIHAAYANFLWEIEDENDEKQAQPMVHTVATASITA